MTPLISLSDMPSSKLSSQPSIAPFILPTLLRSLSPTNSIVPSASPSIAPSTSPSLSPSSPSELPNLSPSEIPSMMPSAAPSLPTKEDHYLDEYTGGTNLTILDDEEQILYCDSLLSFVAVGAGDGVNATCEVLGQEITDITSLQIEGEFGTTNEDAKKLTIVVSIKKVANNAEDLQQSIEKELENLNEVLARETVCGVVKNNTSVNNCGDIKEMPSDAPCESPTLEPSAEPSIRPSNNPSISLRPSHQPSSIPSLTPTHVPTIGPSPML